MHPRDPRLREHRAHASRRHEACRPSERQRTVGDPRRHRPRPAPARARRPPTRPARSRSRARAARSSARRARRPSCDRPFPTSHVTRLCALQLHRAVEARDRRRARELCPGQRRAVEQVRRKMSQLRLPEVNSATSARRRSSPAAPAGPISLASPIAIQPPGVHAVAPLSAFASTARRAGHQTRCTRPSPSTGVPGACGPCGESRQPSAHRARQPAVERLVHPGTKPSRRKPGARGRRHRGVDTGANRYTLPSVAKDESAQPSWSPSDCAVAGDVRARDEEFVSVYRVAALSGEPLPEVLQGSRRGPRPRAARLRRARGRSGIFLGRLCKVASTARPPAKSADACLPQADPRRPPARFIRPLVIGHPLAGQQLPPGQTCRPRDVATTW